MERKKISIIAPADEAAVLVEIFTGHGFSDVVRVDTGLPGDRIPVPGTAAGRTTEAFGPVDYRLTAGSDLVILAVGARRPPCMTCRDLLDLNAGLVRDAAGQIAHYSPGSVLVVIANPLGPMCQIALKASGFHRRRVIGMAWLPHSDRMRHLIAEVLGVCAGSVQAMVLGCHGENMVPLPRFCSVGGIPLAELLPKDQLEAIGRRVRGVESSRKGGEPADNIQEKPSPLLAELFLSVLNDEKKILPCAAHLDGEYGVREVFLGVPCKIGKQGIEQIIQLNLTTEERISFMKSAASVKAFSSDVRKSR